LGLKCGYAGEAGDCDYLFDEDGRAGGAADGAGGADPIEDHISRAAGSAGDIGGAKLKGARDAMGEVGWAGGAAGG
jgi:hypothetical protein